MRIYFFYICHFILGNSAILCDTPWKFQGQKPRPMEIPRVFCKHTLKFHFYFNWPLEFLHALFSIPPETQCPQLNPPVWVFSGIAQFAFSCKLINHNLQRTMFRIFSHLSTKLISNKVKNNKSYLNGVMQLFSSSTDTDRDKNLLEIKSTFPFFSRCFSGSVLHNRISRLSWCISSLSVTLITSAGFHDSLVLHNH